MARKTVGYVLTIDREGEEETVFCPSDETLLYSVQAAIVRWGFDAEMSLRALKEIRNAWNGNASSLIDVWNDWDTTELVFSFSTINYDDEVVIEASVFPDVVENIHKSS